MKTSCLMFLAAALVGTAPLCLAAQSNASSLDSICKSSYIGSLVATFDDLEAVTYHVGNITTNIISNYTTAPSPMGPMFPTASGLEFCNVTLTMSHNNLDDDVSLTGH